MNGVFRGKPQRCEARLGLQQPVKQLIPFFPLVPRFVSLLLLTLCLSGAEMRPGEMMFQEGASYRAEGRQLQDAGDLHRALAAYRMAVVVHPSYAEAYNDLGVILESLGKLSEAEEVYKRALRFKPGLTEAYSNLAFLYEKQGKVQEAGEHWTARVRLHVGPSDDPWVLKAREKLIQYNLPVPKPLAEELRQAIQAGRNHLEAKRWKQAVTEFERARALDPGNREIPQWLRKPQAEAKRTEKLRQKEIETAHVRALKKKAKPLRRGEPAPPSPAGKVSPAAAYAPGTPVSALRVAEEYAREKSKTRQMTTQELYQRGLVALRAGRYDEAEGSFRQILALEPDNRNVQQALVRTEKAKAKAAREAGRKGR